MSARSQFMSRPGPVRPISHWAGWVHEHSARSVHPAVSTAARVVWTCSGSAISLNFGQFGAAALRSLADDVVMVVANCQRREPRKNSFHCRRWLRRPDALERSWPPHLGVPGSDLLAGLSSRLGRPLSDGLSADRPRPDAPLVAPDGPPLGGMGSGRPSGETSEQSR